ncbi:MAG: Lhr family helicase, partial [Brooklawnia sp.]
DTPDSQRRRLVRQPPDILITTPESLFLMLSSAAAETLSDVQTVIVDEVHAIAATKRGAHLALSLERLGQYNPGQQRVGLSATVNPVGQVAGFLGGDRPVAIIEPPATKSWDVRISVAVEDMTQLHRQPADPEQPATNSIWPFITPRILDLIDGHRSTICFVNSRRVAERLTAQLNELHAARAGEAYRQFAAPAGYVARSGASAGHEPIIARAHHGSVSKQRRLEIESELKSGRLPCVVATSSLELGIDMGSVDLVIQVQAPASVSSALQRIGRAGHEVGATSKGILFPTARGDLLECTAITQGMLSARIEPLARLTNPLDVLAQQLVSICLAGPAHPDDLYRMVQRADAYRGLARPAFDAVIDMLCGRYPSEEFGGLRPRLARDAHSGMLTARPGARQLVTTSGGTIPDRGAYGVFLADAAAGGRDAGRRVGELDEEMVYESRVGDVFTLGTTSWRIEQITTNHVLVSPAPGAPGRLPFWHGDSLARPVDLGRALGRLTGQLAADPPGVARELAAQVGLDEAATANLAGYITDQASATGVVPDEHTIVVERFRDELGDWRVAVLCPLGSSVLAPLAMLLRHHVRQRYGVDVATNATNDGLTMRIPDVDAEPPGAELLTGLDAGDIDTIIEAEVAGTTLFAARFRECAARALLLPRRRPGQRSPLWQQRLRASQLLEVASRYPDFPIVLETMRECLHDVFDLPALKELVRSIAARQVRVLAVETAQPSPYAQHAMFGYLGTYIYNDDQPAAERRLAALTLDQGLLDDLLGRESATEFFDRQLIDQLDSELQRVAPGWQATDAEQLWDVLARLGPLSVTELAARSSQPAEVAGWLEGLATQGRVQLWASEPSDQFVAAEDLGWLGGQAVGGQPPEDAVHRLLTRWLRTRVAVQPAEFAARFQLDPGVVATRLAQLTGDGQVLATTLRPAQPGPQYSHIEVLDRLKRRMLADLRSGVEPVGQTRFARFLPAWHELDAPGLGSGALLAAVDQLAGVPLPASVIETLVLPVRVADYQPAMLDELLAEGSVRWTGQGQLGERDGWVQLWPQDVELAGVAADLDDEMQTLLNRLEAGGAWRLADLTDERLGPEQAHRALWQLAWLGLVNTDSFAAVRQWGGQQALRRVHRTPSPRRRLPRVVPPLVPQSPSGHGPGFGAAPGSAVRWAAVARGRLGETNQLVQDVDLLLSRHGVLTRPGLAAEALVGSFAEVYRLASVLEERGLVRRGYFVDGLGGAQFALPGALDRLRDQSSLGPLLLAAVDPANPYGAALPWPASPGHRPNRGAGSMVLLDDGVLVAYLERGARTLLVFVDAGDQRLPSALGLLALAVASGRIDELTIERINGSPALQNSGYHDALQDAGLVMVPQGFRLRR